MATIIREVLNADQMAVTLFTGGQSKVGINLAGTWAGTVAFQASNDGVNFYNVAMTPFASGTVVNSATGNGNWEAAIASFLAFRAVFTRTSGSVAVTMGTSVDASYQDAFLAATSKYVSQSVSGGLVNTVTQAGQANRAWRCRSLSVGFSVAAAAGADVKITDGASAVLWEGYVPPSTNGIAGGGTFLVPLPPPDPSTPGSGGVVGTPGNSMVVTVAAPGGAVVSTINAEFAAA